MSNNDKVEIRKGVFINRIPSKDLKDVDLEVERLKERMKDDFEFESVSRKEEGVAGQD